MKKVIKKIDKIIKLWLGYMDKSSAQHVNDLRQEVLISLLGEGFNIESDIVKKYVGLVAEKPRFILRKSKPELVKMYGSKGTRIVTIIRRTVQKFFDEEKFGRINKRKYMQKQEVTVGSMEEFIEKS